MSGLPLRDNLVGNPSAGQYKTALGLFFDYVSGLHFWGPGKQVIAKDVAFLPGVYGYKFLVCTKAGTTGAELPTIPDVGGTVTDGTAEWSVRDLSNAATADHANLADEATNALKLGGHAAGTGVGNIPVLVDKGGGVAALPAIDGSNLTGIAAVAPLSDHVVSGGKIASVSGLTATHGPLESYISRNDVLKAAGDTQTFLPKRLGLMTIDKTGNRGVVYAADPVTFVDANTIGLWKTDGSATCANLAVGANGNTLAVANDLTRAGTITAVDGLFGGDAAQGDGTSGGYTSANYTNFPINAAEREFAFLYTCGTIGTYRQIVWYGTTASTNGFAIAVLASGNLTVFNMNIAYDTGFTLEAGKSYHFVVGFDGTNAIVYANGIFIYKVVCPCATVASNLYVFTQIGASYPYSNGILHYIELRNKMRTPQIIAEMAIKLIIPVCYDASIANTTGVVTPITLGTPVGNMTSGGGLAAAFDGNSAQTAATGAQYPSQGTAAYTAWIGKSFDIPVQVTSVTLKGSSDYGFSSSGVSVTVTLRGSNDGGVTYDILDTKTVSSNVASDSVTLNYSGSTKYKSIVGYLVDSAVTGGHGTYVAEMTINGYSPTIVRKNITSLVTDALILGSVRTSATGILTVNDADWGIGRREKVYGGNRKVRLTPKPFSGGTPLLWGDPFATKRRRLWINWALDANGTCETPVAIVSSNSYGGVIIYSTPSTVISVTPSTGGVANYNGSWQTSGYLIVYVEVLEDD